jgi:phosphatidylinositol 4-kinase
MLLTRGRHSYLLLSRPSESRALESFVLQRCDEQVHVALLVSTLRELAEECAHHWPSQTLWYFQAALSDLSSAPHSPSFMICQRVFNACQRILFDDPLSSTSLISTTTSSSSVVTGSRRSRLVVAARSKAAPKVLPSNVKASMVGLGAVLASVPGMPSLAQISGRVAVEQGRKKPLGLDRAELEGTADAGRFSGSSDDEEFEDDEGAGEADETDEAKGTGQGSGAESASDGKALAANGAEAEKSAPPTLRSQTMPAGAASSLTPGGILKPPSNPAASPPTSANPFASFASRFDAGFSDFRDKAAAAVGDALGQTFGVDFVPGPESSRKPKAPPAWHPQRRRPRLSLEQGANRFRSAPNLAMARHGGNASPFASTTTFAEATGGAAPNADAVLAQYDPEARRRLLRSNYCRVQTQFLLTLQDISARMLLIPKPARLSALRAELTQLNHSLPSEVCFPLWCRAEARDGAEASATKPPEEEEGESMAAKHRAGRHHRVVRINPSEAVVLNSADRVPFLLHVEVLHDDLDFDPDRRQNRESLKKLVVQEDTRRRKFASSRSFALSDSSRDHSIGAREDATASSSTPATPGLSSDDPMALAESTGSNTAAPPPAPEVATAQVPLSSPLRAEYAVPEDDGEEVDLTEQAFGSDLAAFGEEREAGSSDEDDLTAMNRDHDTAAWTSARGAKQKAEQAAAQFSLDEYSERMRTAAVMLAQLNQSTNAAAHPIVAHNPNVSATAQGGWSSWLTGTSWAGVVAPTKSEAGQGSAGITAPVTGSTAPAAPRASTSGAVSEGMAQALAAGAPGGAKVLHADTEAIRRRIMQEMMALEEERMERMNAAGRHVGRGRRRTNEPDEDEETVMRAVNKDDPSAAMFRESWAMKKARIRASSPYGHLESWDVFSVIVKTGADLRQEQLAVQLISEFGRIWKETQSRCWVRYFRILVTSENSGLMETVTDAVSVHSIKKEAYSRRVAEGKIGTYNLYDHFCDVRTAPALLLRSLLTDLSF